MSALQRLAPRMAGLILIALGFCISVMHAYLFGHAKGEMSTEARTSCAFYTPPDTTQPSLS
jgi:hypothetical protein